jgi:hypothetical protein
MEAVRLSETSVKVPDYAVSQTLLCLLLYLLGIKFDPEDGGTMFLGKLLPNYAASNT